MRPLATALLIWALFFPTAEIYSQDNDLDSFEAITDDDLGISPPLEESKALTDLLGEFDEEEPEEPIEEPIPGGEITLDKGDLEKEGTPGIPLETFLTVGIALLSVSFGKCLKPWDMGKVPLIALVTGASIFLVKEAFTQDDYKNKSEKLLKVEGLETKKEAVDQITAFEKARDQAMLASKASKKKAKNAGFLKTLLTMSAGMFAAFPMIHCAKKVSFGPFYWGCISKYNSTGDECEVEKKCKITSGGNPMLINCPPTSSIDSPLDWLIPQKAYAQENKEAKKQNRSFKKQRLGLAAAAGVIGYTKKVGDRMEEGSRYF